MYSSTIANVLFDVVANNLFSRQGITVCVVLLSTAYISLSYFRDFRVGDLQKKVVLITGCDTGFGHELAKKLDALGLRVFAGCLTSDGEYKLTNECSKNLRTLRLNVTEPGDVAKALEFVKEHLSPDQGLWAVVNNAGIGYPAPIEWQTVEEMKRMVDVNLWGMVAVTKTFLPLLKIARGRVVNVASSSGRVANPGAAAYCISKFGVEAFSDSLRVEVKYFGVTVHVIEPGMFRTNMTDAKKQIQHFERLWENLDVDTKESYGTEFVEKGIELLNQFKWIKSPHIHKVVNALEHAVTSSQPRLRYTVGWDHKLIWRTLSLLPSQIQDLVFFSYPKPKGISSQ